MKFELKEYHRDLSDDALLDDIRRISEKYPEKYISRSLYEKEGVYSATPFLRRWGSWIGVLEAAGLRTERKQGDYKRIDNKELIDDVVRIAEMLSKNSVTTKEYSEYGKYKVQTLLSRFKSWNSVLDAASLAGTDYKVIKDTDLYEEIERLWIEKGSQLFQACILNFVEKMQEFHGIDMTEVIPQNFLALAVSMKALDENVIRAKYPEEIANKMISTDAQLRPMIEENNQGFAIKIEHLHFITKDRNQATSFVHVDKNAEAGVKIIKELNCGLCC